MGPESSLPHSQTLAIWPCTGPHQSSPYAHNDTDLLWVAWEAVESNPYDS